MTILSAGDISTLLLPLPFFAPFRCSLYISFSAEPEIPCGFGKQVAHNCAHSCPSPAPGAPPLRGVHGTGRDVAATRYASWGPSRAAHSAPTSSREPSPDAAMHCHVDAPLPLLLRFFSLFRSRSLVIFLFLFPRLSLSPTAPVLLFSARVKTSGG